jgi:hypothetical protein
VRVVVPAARQGGPDALPQDVHQLGPHDVTTDASSNHFFLLQSCNICICKSKKKYVIQKSKW